MALFTDEEKKSMGITAAMFTVLLLVLIFVKFSSATDLVDLEGGGGGGGVTVNFGDSDVGSGADFRSEVLNVKQRTEQAPAASAPEDEVIASDVEDAPAVIKTKPTVNKEPRKEETKPVQVKAPQPSKATSDALANILNGNSKGGDGDDGVAGNKGKAGGDKNSDSYYGDGGSGGGTGGGNGSGDGTGTGPGSGSGSGGGSGAGRGTGVGNYQLAGRKNLNKPAPKGCNEEGQVTVQITVDSSGKVIKADTGRGTIASPCLINQAKQAALNTKFEAGDAAQQVGKIIYNFRLRD